MLVKVYTLMALLVLGTVALGLQGVLDGEQTVKILLGIVAAIQGLKEAVREIRRKDGQDEK